MEDRRETGGHYAVWLALLVCAGALGIPPASAGAERVLLAPSVTMTDLKLRALYRPDPEGVLRIEELLASDEGFEPYDPALEQEAPPLWLKLKVAAVAEHRSDFVLLVKRRFFQRLDVYLPSTDGSHDLVRSGIRNYEPSTMFGNEFAYPFHLDGEGEILIHASIFQGSLRPLDISIRDSLSYQQHKSVGYWAYGLYFGAMLALIFYNLVIYLNLRTPGHRWYVAAMSCVLLFMGLDSGLLQRILPELLRLREPIYFAASAALLPAATARFLQVFVKTHFHVPGLHRVVSWFIGICLAMALVALVLPMQYAAHAALWITLVSNVTWLLLILTSLLAALRGSVSGYVFLAAWTAFVLGAVVRVFVSLDVIDRLPPAEFSIYIGSVMEAMILALGLSYRVGQLRTQRNRALRAQYKAARLANIDPLTGAYNRRFVENYLDGLLDARGKRAFLGSLIMLDLDRFKEANDEYGHAAGDAILRELTRRCQDSLRTEDVLARLGGDEFAVVLPDQSGEDALAVAERIRSRIATKPVVHEGHRIFIAASIGVITDFAPGATPYSAFKHADKAMYEAKRAGRNQVVVRTGGAEPPPARRAVAS